MAASQWEGEPSPELATRGRISSDPSLGVTATVLCAIGVVPLGWHIPHPLRCRGSAHARSWAYSPGPRVALTNYLSQSLLGIVIFYGIGFTFSRSLGPWQFTVAIFAVQVGYGSCGGN